MGSPTPTPNHAISGTVTSAALDQQSLLGMRQVTSRSQRLDESALRLAGIVLISQI